MRDESLKQSPDDLVAPDLNVDKNFFDFCSESIESNLSLLADFKPNVSGSNEMNIIDTLMSGIYFDRLNKAMHFSNEMIEPHRPDEAIGLQLSTPNETFEMFEDTFDAQLVVNELI